MSRPAMPAFVQLTTMDPALQRRDSKHADATTAALAALSDDLEGRTGRVVVALLRKKTLAVAHTLAGDTSVSKTGVIVGYAVAALQVLTTSTCCQLCR